MSLECGRKLEHLEETHRGMQTRTDNLSANHLVTVLPDLFSSGVTHIQDCMHTGTYAPNGRSLLVLGPVRKILAVAERVTEFRSNNQSLGWISAT
ncbi:hypothetical protein AB205_0057310 [Aquarana catesbeiana]|uniref:Uncharacterized protein n=1 Tax=Aquarana catesbeiana TaxID=8400 RepID=A0A2G9SKR5_AQUCT|nr:hypothetical protein AB205_0057310 [Aquarana catesbeiana]